jgi:DNA modification methylase
MARNKAATEKLSPINQFSVEWWDVERPIDYPLNARKWKPAAVAKVAESIKNYGWRQPIVVDDAGVIVIGHLRRAAARQAGLTQVPVHVAAGLSPEVIRGLRLADNRTHDEAEWDMELLAREFGELKALNFDLAATAFSLREIDSLTSKPNAAEDDVPPVPEVPITQPGDLWVMGGHRLLCGDSTDEASVARLMDGERAGLIATDPPYGISYDSAELHEHGVSYAKIDGDHHEDEKLQAFLEKAFAVALTAIRPDAAWYLWHAMLTQGFFAAAAAAAAAHVILHRQIIWSKPVLVFGRGQYHWKHELCFMGWVKGNEPPDYSEHKDVTVWEVKGVELKDRRDFKHSTPKPVELFRRPIIKHLQTREIAYEPFSGSGPQFIAAELTGRRCFGVEIEPAYCDVIVKRWETLTGKKAELCRT